MNTLLYLALTLCFQDSAVAPDIWTQIGQAENKVDQAVKNAETQFAVSATNPVRGYHVPGRGVFLVVPLRYRALSAWQSGSRKKDNEQDAGVEEVKDKGIEPLNREDFQRRLAQWEERKRAHLAAREANFQKVVNGVKAQIPGLMKNLNLAPDEGLVIAVEEAPPAYYYANFALNRNPTRKVVTLAVDSALIQKVKTSKVERESDWLTKVEATTTRRALAAAP